MEFLVAQGCAEELRTGSYDLLSVRPVGPTINNFLRGLVEDLNSCWRAIEASKGKELAVVGYIGGNAATIIQA